MSIDPIEVSIVIPAYNASATMAQVLEAVLKQDYPKPFEVIVVDDGSLDGTAEIIKSFPSVVYLYQANAGPASARNYGAKIARGNFLAFTDSDCIPHQDWISQLLKSFHQKDVAVVAGSYGIANPQSPLAHGVHAEIKFRHIKLMPDFPKSFGSYNFCISRKVFETVGGFNSGYRQASGEDNDLSYKILGAGHRIYFQRQALVDHYHPTRMIKYLREQFRHGVWRVKMYQDHPQMMKGDGYTFWKDVLEIPLAGGFLLVLIVSVFVANGFKVIVSLALLAFIIFEIAFAYYILRKFFESIYFGFILFFRAFARTFGFSTGIFLFFNKKMLKISK